MSPKSPLKSPLVIVALVIGALILVPFLAVVFLVGVGSSYYQQAERSGNEATAAQTLDSLRKFQAQYAARNRGKFGTFDELIAKAGLDPKFAGDRPIVNGYTFAMVVEPSSLNKNAFYSISADPIVGSGSWHFHTDSSLSVMKFTDENRPANPDDPGI